MTSIHDSRIQAKFVQRILFQRGSLASILRSRFRPHRVIALLRLFLVYFRRSPITFFVFSVAVRCHSTPAIYFKSNTVELGLYEVRLIRSRERKFPLVKLSRYTLINWLLDSAYSLFRESWLRNEQPFDIGEEILSFPPRNSHSIRPRENRKTGNAVRRISRNFLSSDPVLRRDQRPETGYAS